MQTSLCIYECVSIDGCMFLCVYTCVNVYMYVQTQKHKVCARVDSTFTLCVCVCMRARV